MKIDFNYKIMVDIWSDYIDEEMVLIPADLSDELREAIRKEIIKEAEELSELLIDTRFTGVK